MACCFLLRIDDDARLAVCRRWSVVLRRKERIRDVGEKSGGNFEDCAVIIRLAESIARVHVAKTACLVPRSDDFYHNRPPRIGIFYPGHVILRSG